MSLMISTISYFYLAVKSNNLGLILGVSLGVGIPVLVSVLGGAAYYIKRNRRKDTYLTRGIELQDRTNDAEYQYMGNAVSSTSF